MSKLRSILLAACAGSLAACAAAPAPGTEMRALRTAEPGARPAPAARQTSLDRDTARLRAATAPFRKLSAAVAAGYPERVDHCVAHPQDGGMGYHHVNMSLMDNRLEVERPEILVYSRLASGEYVLNGVEYVIPYTIRPPDATPPRIMGQALKRSAELKIWYLHVWIWNENPSGLFADWNPNVRCG